MSKLPSGAARTVTTTTASMSDSVGDLDVLVT
jgi:hypothetical protein